MKDSVPILLVGCCTEEHRNENPGPWPPDTKIPEKSNVFLQFEEVNPAWLRLMG